MSIILREERKQKKLIPIGMHVARCYSEIHIGTIYDNRWDKHIDKIRISWEFPNELAVFKEENGEQPFVKTQEYTITMSDMGKLRPMLENWRGKAFTEKETEGFDLAKLISIPCMINIIHNKDESTGLIYDNIASVNPLPKGTECPAQINPSFEFNYDDKFDLDYIETLPDFIKDKIKSSVEYKANIDKMMGEEEANKQNAVMDKQADDAIANDAEDDGLPF